MSRLSTILLIAFLFFVAACAKSAEVAKISPEGKLYLGVMDAYDPLSKCMQPFLTGTPGEIKSRARRAYELADANQLELSATEVLGEADPVIQASRAEGLNNLERTRILLAALGEFSIDDRDESLGHKALQAKALAIAMIQLARTTDGRCKPSQNLISWMEQVPNANQ